MLHGDFSPQYQRYGEKILVGSYLKVDSYDTYLRYWRVLTPQVITFDPEGVRAYVLHKTCQETPDLSEYAQKLHFLSVPFLKSYSPWNESDFLKLPPYWGRL